jgi:hypothetical protein
VTGGLISNTLAAAPAPQVTENIHTNPSGPTYTGSILVTASRQFAISGYVDTSHGRVVTTVEESVQFANRQEFDVNASIDVQNVQQSTSVDARVVTRSGEREETHTRRLVYPLNIRYAYLVNADGSASQTTSIDQSDEAQEGRGEPWSLARLFNEVRSTDTLNWDAQGNLIGPTGAATSQVYTASGPFGCYGRTLTAQNQVLTGVKNGTGCPRP